MFKTSVEQLKNIPLFTFVDDEELNLIADKLELKDFPDGEIIIKEGEAGDTLFLIKSGKVKVYSQNNEKKQETILTYLESGDHFGEMSLISGEPRSASVVAVSPVEVWELTKPVFDTLIMNNPSITLTLTHLLTQRLKESNIKRLESEDFYEQKFMPHGSLNDTKVVALLKYAEDNSLSGRIVFEKDKDSASAIFNYKKGHLVNLEFGDKEEDEAMDSILQWEDGSYRIEPNIIKPENPKQETIEEEKPKQDDKTSVVKLYIEEKLKEFVHFAGAKITQRALNRSYHNFKQYFDNIDQIQIEILPEIKIDFKTDKWNDKLTLLLAVLIRDVVEAIDRDAIGMMFWSPRSDITVIDAALEDLQYFEYYEQAMDIITT